MTSANGMLAPATSSAGPSRLRNDPRVAVPKTRQPAAGQPGQATASSSHSPASSRDSKQAIVNGVDATLTNGLSGLQLNSEANIFKPQASPYLKHLFDGSQPEVTAPVIVSSSGKTPAISKSQSPIGTRPDGDGRPSTKFSTDAGPPFVGGHFLKVTGCNNGGEFDMVLEKIRAFDPTENIALLVVKPVQPGPNNPTSLPIVFLLFDDIAHAGLFKDRADIIQPSWSHEWVFQADYDKACNIIQPTSGYLGQVRITARPTEQNSKVKQDLSVLEQDIIKLAAKYGNVLAFQELPVGNQVEYQCRVEFRKISEAALLLQDIHTMNPMQVGDYTVVSEAFKDDSCDADNEDRASAHSELIISPSGRTEWTLDRNGEMHLTQPNHAQVNGVNSPQPPPYQAGLPVAPYHLAPPPQAYQGHQGHHNNNCGNQRYNGNNYQGQLSSRQVGFRQGALHNHWGRRNNNDQRADRSTEPQYIHLQKVFNGRDVRTTIMLRNIPNHWTCHDLKARLDENCAGQYDFSYLRIDFAHNTNVGYGFINFTDARYVGPFIMTMTDTEWQPGHFPRKRFEASYATIQGVDCLIEKFRNSSIMSEFRDFRPKLWYVAEDAPTPGQIGVEKPFPPPNNASKTQRSHDNAGAVGLFAPRSAQRQHPRRSQWDRGTTRQIFDDAAYFDGSETYTTAPPPPPGWFVYGPPLMPAGVAPPYVYQYHAGDMVPRAFSGAPTQQGGPAAAPRGGPVGRGHAETYY